jgi:hypothetical protein
VGVLCELPSPQPEVTTIIPCEYEFAKGKFEDADDDDICDESYGRD